MFSYDALGRPNYQINSDSSTRSFTYDGSTVLNTDEAGTQTKRTLDAFGHLTQVTELGSVADPHSFVTTYQYNSFGNLVDILQSGNGVGSSVHRSFTYDGFSRLLSSQNPETGAVCFGPLKQGVCSSGYDPNGNLTVKTDASVTVTKYSYDALNRLMFRTLGDGTVMAAYGYDGHAEQGDPIPQAQNALGRLTTSTEQRYSASLYSYDQVGRLITQTYAIPSDLSYTLTATAGYDLAGNQVSLTYPDGRVVSTSYDSAGRLQTIGENGVTGSYIQAVTYNPDGTPFTTTYGNGVVQTISENSRLQVGQMSIDDPIMGVNYLSHDYCYAGCPTGGVENNGNIWQIRNNKNASLTQSFTYDGLNRIASFSLGGAVTQQYNIDAMGNMSLVMNGTPVSRFNSANQIINLPCSAYLVPYDSNGNQRCDSDTNQMWSYLYDGDNRISSASLLTSTSPFVVYTYTADGSRVRKYNPGNNNSTEYVNFNSEPVAEKDQTGAWVDYIYANGKKIARDSGFTSALHTAGTRNSSSVNQACGAAWDVSVAGWVPRVIVAGDRLLWNQKEVVSQGGMTFMLDGNELLVVPDEQGQQYSFTEVPEQTAWHKRSALLDTGNYVGRTLMHPVVTTQNSTEAKDFEQWIADAVIVGKDGTVTPVFTGAATSGALWSGCGVANPTLSTDMATTDGSNTGTHFLMSDHLGSASMEFTARGWPVSQSQFAPYGGEINPPVVADHYKFTGKERDTESGLDYFGARYYGSNMGRWMSPDSVNVTEDRMMNPSSTLNKYAYGANNPLKYTDPDGKDITIFYEPGNPISGSPGHTMLLAYDQSTGQSAIRSFGPDYAAGANKSEVAIGISSPGTDTFGFSGIKTADDLRANFASITIQTSPEETQAVINAINTHPDGNYTTFWNNCTTTCSKLLRQIGKTKSHALYPGAFFDALMSQYGNRHPTGKVDPLTYTVGYKYGNPRPGYDPFQLFFNDIPQQHEKVTSRIVHWQPLPNQE